MHTLDILCVSGTGIGWFKLNAPNCVTHEFRMQYLLECHIFGIILTAMNSGRGVHSHLFVQDLELTLL